MKNPPMKRVSIFSSILFAMIEDRAPPIAAEIPTVKPNIIFRLPLSQYPTTPENAVINIIKLEVPTAFFNGKFKKE